MWSIKIKIYRYILTLYKQFYLISAERRMPSNKQNKNSLPNSESLQQKQELILFFKSYLKYIKKILENSGSHSSQTSIFDLKKISGNISLELFLQRVLSYFKCGPEAYICSLCFIHRFFNSENAKTERIVPSIRNIFKIISVALLVATKNFDDFYYTNAYYSRVCGLTLQQLNLLEKQFLKIIDFDVFVDSKQYQSYSAVLQSYKKIYAAEMKHLMQKQNFGQKENLKQPKKTNLFQDKTNYQTPKEGSPININIQVVA